MKKLAQNIFKNFFRKIFTFFYGKIKIEKNLNKLNKKNISSININKKNYGIDNVIYEIDDARIYTDLVENVAIIQNNKLIPEISFQQIDGELKTDNHNKVLIEGTPRVLKKINAIVVNLSQGVSGCNYFHFLFDILTRLKLFSEIINLDKIDYFYLQGKIPWQLRILEIIGINKEKIIDSYQYRHIKVKKLYACKHPWYRKGYFQSEINNLPEWLVFYLRNRFLKLGKNFKCSKKVFIDRSDSNFNHCKLINNEEIKSFLEEKGFESYQISKLSFEEQIYLFNNAEIIISPHGAALTNVIFSSEKLHLIELIPSDHPSRKCQRISNLIRFKYDRIELERVKNRIESTGEIKLDKKILEKYF